MRMLFAKRRSVDLVFTQAPHLPSLVFAPPDVAEHVSAIHHALEAKTWGAFRTLMPPKEYQTLLIRIRDGEFEYEDEDGNTELCRLPSNDDQFDYEFWFPEHSDGDYPDWLQTRQEEWLPEVILQRFGHCEMSVLNGPFWMIDPACEDEIVEALRREGLVATRRNDLNFY